MIKVAYLLGSLNRGGTETLLLDVFRNADKASFEFIGVHRKGGAYQEEFYAAGPKMVKCAPKRFGLIRYLLRLRQLLKQENVTIVHAQQSIDCVYARLATIGTSIRIVETFHGFDFHAGRFNKWINWISIRMADAVCFVSKTQRDYYIRAYGIKRTDKLHVVYNGIDFGKFDKKYPEPDFGESGKERLKLCMVGNFVHTRDQMVVIKALEKVDNFDFYFVGRRDKKEPWRYDECVKYCEEHRMKNVHFVGGRGDVPAILQNMDAFVYATAHDTFGIAVVEALANGLPVIVNDWGVMREVTHDGEWAMLYKTGDSVDCAEAIRNLIEHIEEEKKRAQKIAQEIRNAYSIETHLQRLAEVYSE